MAQQGPPPPRRFAGSPARGRRGRPGRPDGGPGRPDWTQRPDPRGRVPPDAFNPDFEGDEEDLPPWAGLAIHPTVPGGRRRRPPRDDERPGPAPRYDRTGLPRGSEAAGRPSRYASGPPRGGEWSGPAPGAGYPGPPDDRAARDERADWDIPPDEDWQALPDAAMPGGPGWRGGPADRQPDGGSGGRFRGRAAAARARKSRRRLFVGTGAVVVVVVVVLAILGDLPGQGGSPKPSRRGLVTTFQPGEFRKVPNACRAVSAAALHRYLPGTAKSVQSLDSSAQSQCTWTLDAKPVYRVLEVTSQAYAPSLLAPGDGSATSNATGAYHQALQTLRHPTKASHQPKARIGAALGLGQEAFTALQVFHVGGVVNDKVTVVTRDRNVLITVTLQGQEHGHGFGPVPTATLRAGALAVAHEVRAGVG